MAVRVSSPVLIGREEELGRLRAALDRTIGGEARVTLVAGEAGVGKTRLVVELGRIAEAAGATVLRGGCIDVGEGALPYAPVVEALRSLVRATPAAALDELLGPARPELARLLPDLGPAAEAAPLGLSIQSGQGRLFELLLGLFDRLARRAPVVVVLEDLHWSDRSTRDLVGFLVRNLRAVPVMLVMTYRSDELHRRHPLLPFLAELERSGAVERIDLRRLDRGESTALLTAIAGEAVDPELAESIHVRSGGNPFFAEELLVAAGNDGAAELPATLRDVLLGRVAELAEPAQELLRIASAAGQRVDPELLAAAAGLDEATLYEALRECVARQVLVLDPTSGRERYAFRHALLQEAIYDDLLPGDRTRLHAAFARTLEERLGATGEHAPELAYHWYAAHNLPRALETSIAAARADEARYAYAEATVHYERVLQLWDQVPDAEARAGSDRIDVLAAVAGDARFHEPNRAVAHIQSAIDLARPAGDPVRIGLLHERLGRYAWAAGHGELSERAYRTAAEVIPPDPPSEARARALAGLAQILFLHGRIPESRPLADEALAIARAAGARAIEGHALNTRGADRVVEGEVDEAVEDLRASLRIAVEVGSADDVGRAYANWTWVLDVAGRHDDARALAEEGIATSERLGIMAMFGTHLLYWVADRLYRLGRWDEAERAARRAESIGPIGINAILVPEVLARLAMARGRFEEAAALLQPLTALAARAADLQFVIPVQGSLAELQLWQGRPAEGAVEATRGIRLLRATSDPRVGELYALALRGYADVAEEARAGRAESEERAAIEAGDALLEALSGREAGYTDAQRVAARWSAAWLPLCEAEATRLHGRPEPAAWTACIEAWTPLERPGVMAYLRWREAESILEARGDRELASAAIGAALEIAQRLGAEPLAREVTGLAARARLPLASANGGREARAPADSIRRSPDPAERLGLTRREREVLALVALGRTNRQIADELFISENTAGVHVSNILGKLEVTSRGEAAAVAYRLGLAAPPD